MEAPRRSNGQFQRHWPRDAMGLYEAVRAGCLLVSERLPRRFPTPLTVSQDAFDAHLDKLVLTFGEVPPANEICRQLADIAGAPYPWQQLKDDVFADDVDVRTHAARRRAPRNYDLTDENVDFALNYVAERLGVDTFSSTVYGVARDGIVVEGVRRGRDDIGWLFPTEQQILHYVSYRWPVALRIAGLREEGYDVRKGRSVSVTEAIIRFSEATDGYLPSFKQLRTFARIHRFALQDRTTNRDWEHVYLDPAVEEMRTRGLPEPHPYSERLYRPVFPIPDRRYNNDDPEWRPKRFWGRGELMEQIVAFVLWLPCGASGTVNLYRSWSYDHEDRPSLQPINDAFGNLDEAVRLARQPGAVERANAEEKELARARREERDAENTERRLNHEIAASIEAVLRELGEATIQDLVDRTHQSPSTTRTYLRWMREAYVIETTNPHTQAKNQAYRLVGYEYDRAAARRRLERKQARRRVAAAERTQTVLRALVARNELSPAEIQREIGSPTRVDEQLGVLRQAEYVEKVGQGRSVRYRPTRDGRTYQAIRSVAAARYLAAAGRRPILALVYDAANPYFGGCGDWPGWPAVLAQTLGRHDDEVGFRSVSWQELIPTLPLDDDFRDWLQEKHRL